MSDNTILSPRAWREYTELQDQDRRMLKKINQLINIQEIARRLGHSKIEMK